MNMSLIWKGKMFEIFQRKPGPGDFFWKKFFAKWTWMPWQNLEWKTQTPNLRAWGDVPIWLVHIFLSLMPQPPTRIMCNYLRFPFFVQQKGETWLFWGQLSRAFPATSSSGTAQVLGYWRQFWWPESVGAKSVGVGGCIPAHFKLFTICWKNLNNHVASINASFCDFSSLNCDLQDAHEFFKLGDASKSYDQVSAVTPPTNTTVENALVLILHCWRRILSAWSGSTWSQSEMGIFKNLSNQKTWDGVHHKNLVRWENQP